MECKRGERGGSAFSWWEKEVGGGATAATWGQRPSAPKVADSISPSVLFSPFGFLFLHRQFVPDPLSLLFAAPMKTATPVCTAWSSQVWSDFFLKKTSLFPKRRKRGFFSSRRRKGSEFMEPNFPQDACEEGN